MEKSAKRYCDFISVLDRKFSSVVGEIWWYSLIHEKNPNKSRSIHGIIKWDINQRNKIGFIKALLLGIRKYFVFLARYFLFSFGRFGINHSSPQVTRMIIGYGGDSFSSLKTDTSIEIIIPQKVNWKNLRGKYLLDRMLSVSDFFVVGVKA